MQQISEGMSGSQRILSKAGNLEIISWSEPTVEMNLALDERLAQESARTGKRILRFWWGSEPPTAVLGCGDKPEVALDKDECARRGVGWVKRVTGGGTVLQTPDVFNYSYTAPESGCFDMKRVFEQGAELVIGALEQFGVSAQQRGISDVAVGDLKISGNAQARKWKSILLHGTLMLGIDRELMEAVLRHPHKEPDYRGGRNHCDFIITLNDLGIITSRDQVEEAFMAVAKYEGIFISAD